MAIDELAYSLKNAIDLNVTKLIEVCYRRSLDHDENIKELAIISI